MRCVIALAMLLAVTPAMAQDGAAPEGTLRDDLGDGADLMTEGARRFLDGLMSEIDPAMRGLSEVLRDWNLEGFSLRDLDDYRAPEMLPNGDIIIRRKTPLPPGEGEVDI